MHRFKAPADHAFVAIAGCIVFLSILATLATGCARKPLPPPKTSDLHFPVVVLYSTGSTVLYSDAADLDVMHMNLLTMSTSPPLFIDSSFSVCTMEHLQSTHGGLWLMAHPSGTTEVKFDLARAAKTGMEAARSAMRAQLDRQTWRNDLDKKRAALTKQTTLKGMLGILQEEEDSGH